MNRRQLFAAFAGLLLPAFTGIRVKRGKYITTYRDRHGKLVGHELTKTCTNLATNNRPTHGISQQQLEDFVKHSMPCFKKFTPV